MRVAEPGLIPHRWLGAPVFATLVERPNKFLAICRIARRAVEAHVPDRGRCLDLLVPGQPLVLVEVGGQEGIPRRRTRYTVLLARARAAPSPWVSLDPAGAPRLVAVALERGLLPELAGHSVVGRELTFPRLRARPRPRIDLLLRAPSGEDVACEVKSVGAAREGVALFPDAPTLRGLRHLALLARLARRGVPAALVLCAQRGDVSAIAADESIDPAFARALRTARRAGVAVAGLRCAAHPGGMELLGPVPVL
ncbi:MAG TPA: DNA/RNA nuclease SfsA [Myxococcales bacterium]|nr:DNA/RNA nuclease SfsA [Myxococcales bacterium]